ncbi:hypothetical protein bcere0022_47330 [Bacillus cereus Rock3-44]|nr:hypothetical protein bcere0022_47330 [Bacillus cereus Rock3-44]
MKTKGASERGIRFYFRSRNLYVEKTKWIYKFPLGINLFLFVWKRGSAHA